MIITNNKKTKKRNHILTIIILVIISIIIWFSIAFNKAKISPIEEASLFLINSTQPIQKIINSPVRAVSDFFNFFKIRKNYYILKEKEVLFTQDISKIEELKNENNLLLNALNNKKKHTRLLEAKALKTGTNKFSFYINKGKNNNIKLNTNVVIKDNILVGKVIELYDNYSLVESIYSPNINIGVINTLNNKVGLLKKDSMGNLKITLYSEDEDFKKGDIIKTSLENSDFIQGLLIGKVFDIKIESTYQNILIEPFFNFNQLSNVLLIIE